ncbi:hypothetical protein ADILRU_1787 [Leifsonia rubra CMS 76R]|nr:hypothetical protein ADILRU_1787 [Leifsonia rubra CMS 76R]
MSLDFTKVIKRAEPHEGEILCIAFDSSGEQITGSLAGAAK